MSVKERLIRFAKSKEKSVRAFEIKSGLTIGYVNAIRVSIQPDKIQSIVSHYPDLNITWLMTGEGEMLKHEVQTEDSNKEIMHMEDEKITDFERFNKVVYYLIKHGFVRSQEQLAQELGHIEKVLLDIGKGRRPLKIKLVYKLCELYKVINPDYLLVGNAPMLKSELSDKKEPVSLVENTLPEDISIIPLLPIYAQGGSLNDFFGSVRDIDCEHIISPIRGVDFAITVSGESMSPEFPNGSKILIKKINEKAFIEWGRVYVLDTCNGAVVKTLEDPKKEGCVLCTSLNPDPKFSPFFVNTEDIIGMYRVMMCMTVK